MQQCGEWYLKTAFLLPVNFMLFKIIINARTNGGIKNMSALHWE